MYYHNMTGTSIERSALDRYNRCKKDLNICLSSYSYLTEQHLQKYYSTLRYAADNLLVDSSIKSIVKQNQKDNNEYLVIDWINNQQRIIDIANTVNADIVSMVDIPVDVLPWIGRSSPVDYLQMNYENAIEFSKLKTDMTKMYILQGLNPGDYMDSLDKFNEIMDVNSWIAFGKSIAGWKKRFMFESINRLRRATDRHFHVLGVSSLEYIDILKDIGVDSIDGTYALQIIKGMTNTSKDHKVEAYLEAIKSV